MAKCIMIQGTMSDVGKSLLTAGLCRIFTRAGYRCAPFKSQNMALNSCATADGREIGRAQAMQAAACGIPADARMNPVLLKPTGDTGSQVVVMGEVFCDMKAGEYFSYRKRLLPRILEAYHSLASEKDVMVIEGAGSCCELNLAKDDIVNMGLANALNAPVLLCADIDRGGVFAQLYGTIKLLGPKESGRIEGLVVNKFRGDRRLFDDGVQLLEETCSRRVLGVIPYINDLRIDGEDSLALSELKKAAEAHRSPGGKQVAVIELPHMSNYTDVGELVYHDGYNISFVDTPEALAGAELIIIPGTKSVAADRQWLADRGFDEALRKAAEVGVLILGICGGYQILGRDIADPHGVEGKKGRVKGLGLLPVRTTLGTKKCVRQMASAILAEPFAGERRHTYEIHMGQSEWQNHACRPFARLCDGSFDGCVFHNIYGTYLHGLFTAEQEGTGQDEYDRLADVMEKALDMDYIYSIMERYP